MFLLEQYGSATVAQAALIQLLEAVAPSDHGDEHTAEQCKPGEAPGPEAPWPEVPRLALSCAAFLFLNTQALYL